MINSTVTIVIPVYNDLQALHAAIPATILMMEKITSDFEIIIAEDASTDGSKEFAAEYAEKDPRITHMHRENRLGRGSALTLAAGKAKGDLFCYFDVDMATDMEYLLPLLSTVEGTADIATGSRLLDESEINRSLGRELKSQGYNFLVRSILGSKLHDHQCGFKAFRRLSLVEILKEVKDTHWFWDTEVLVRGQKKGYSVIEIPVVWCEGKGTTVKTNDIWKMGRSIFRLWWQLHVP